MAASAEIQIQTSPRPFGATKNQLKVISKMEFQETCGNTAYQLLLQNLRKLLKLKEEKVANPVTAFQPLIHGKLFQTTDIALVTRNQSSQRDPLLHAWLGLDKLIHMLDGSSSEVKETTTALLAHKATQDIKPLELEHRTLESTSMRSQDGNDQQSQHLHQHQSQNQHHNQDGITENGRELQTTDIALVTRNQSSPREALLIALTGLDKLMQMPDGSSSEVKEIITALLAHKATLDTQLQEQANKTQRSTSMKLLAGQNHKNHGYHTTRELLIRDTASTTQNLFSTTELLMLAVLGLNHKTEKLSISSSDHRETTTALHAHRHTEEVTQVLLIRINKSTFMRSLDIHLQSTLGLKSTRELLGTDTALVTRNQHSITEALRTAVLGLEKLIHKPDTSSSEVKETTIALLAHLPTRDIP